MSQIARSLALVIMTISSGVSHQSVAQKRRASTGFQGQWVWSVIARNRSDLPPAYQNMKVKDVPESTLELYLKQKGSVLTGEYGAGARFLAKVELGSFTALIRGHVAQVKLESGHGGRVIAKITLRGDKLYWKLVRAEGEYYFPDQVLLHRVSKSALSTAGLKISH
jgi:redox-sensitive bicupin YhaK (pirin superfamily)